MWAVWDSRIWLGLTWSEDEVGMARRESFLCGWGRMKCFGFPLSTSWKPGLSGTAEGEDQVSASGVAHVAPFKTLAALFRSGFAWNRRRCESSTTDLNAGPMGAKLSRS